MRLPPANQITDLQFNADVSKALATVNTILSNTRNPCIATPDIPHTYDDKFALSIYLTRIAMMAILNALMMLGIGQDGFGQLVNIVVAKKKSATLRFTVQESCEFIKETKLSVESPVQDHIEIGSTKLGTGFMKKKTIVTTPQYHWKLDIHYKIHVFAGNESNSDEDSLVLHDRTISCVLITATKEPPFPEARRNSNPLDVPLTWLVQHLDLQPLTVKYSIDRSAESCRTPKQNAEVKEAMQQLENIRSWCHGVSEYFINLQETITRRSADTLHETVKLYNINGEGIFVPVLPLFENIEKQQQNLITNDGTTPEQSSPVLSDDDVHAFLAEQCKTITEQMESLNKQFSSRPPSGHHLITESEAFITLLCCHLHSIVDLWRKSLHYIEKMLEKQLYDAIGKTVQSKDLNEFVNFHNQRLFEDTYAPEPFCYAVRRPSHYPDGLISIEEKETGTEKNVHAMTFTRKLESKDFHPIHIPINAATSVEFRGDMFLHAWLLQRFESRPQSFQLAARARQFSSFMLLVGKVAGADVFEPQHGIILQNKDEVLIPLLTEDIPSAKEFKDAIESLSPEQKRFAEAFRNMKLASSVFGVCVIQLKPQLEVLLGLPKDSLTKEIRLTQDLLNLFIEYQIPSDLLSFDGSDDADLSTKVEAVRQHVGNIKGMVEDAKKEDIKSSMMKAQYENPQPLEGAMFGSSDPFGGIQEAQASAMTFGSGAAPLFKSAKGFGSSKEKYKARAAPKARTMAVPCAAPGAIVAEAFVSAEDSSSISQRNDVTETMDFETNQLDPEKTDLTMIPKQLDKAFEKFGSDETYGGVVRSATIKTGDRWKKASQSSLLSPMKTNPFYSDDQKVARNAAFDLLDALSRSGSLPIECAELHVIVSSTHCFEKSVVQTVIADNVNPIEKIERSHLLVASMIHNVPIERLLRQKGELQRIAKYSPLLIEGGDGKEGDDL